MTSDEIVERLVVETLLPMFYKLNPAPRGWNTGLVNVCVMNMVGPAAGEGGGVRDIGTMFRRQDDVLREFTAYDDGGYLSAETTGSAGPERVREDRKGLEVAVVVVQDDEGQGFESDDAWDEHREQNSSQEEGAEKCPLCGHFLPSFALAAHERFHRMEMNGD
jgi:DNA polymerase iota